MSEESYYTTVYVIENLPTKKLEPGAFNHEF